MKPVLHDLVQGTDAWMSFRLKHHGASEAAAMLGMSLNVKRSELLRMKHTGLPKEFSDWVQEHILDHGHRVEALARPHIEEVIDDDLYPVTYSLGRLSASCDGLTLDGTIAMEHKQWSQSLADRMDAGAFPEEHMPQCQQVMLVTGAKRLIFVVSNGTRERMRFMWVKPDPEWFDRLRRGWAQFDADLAAYELPAAEEPAPVGRAPEQLPALSITITGGVQSSNLAAFKATALGAIRSVNRDLQTDQHFADADKSVKWCEDVESRIKAAKEHALGQTASIDELFRTMDEISAEARKVRLDLAKLIETRKAARRGEIVAGSRKAVIDYVEQVNAKLPARWVACPTPDFGEAIKGKKSFANMRDACDVLVAEAKILVDKQREVLVANREVLKIGDRDWITLFPDFATVGIKALEDFAALANLRIGKQEESERLAREAEDKRKADEAAAAATDAAAAPAPAPEPAPAPIPAPASVARTAAWAHARPVAPSPAPPAANEPATLNLGAICGRLGFTVTAAFLQESLEITPAASDKAARLYRESDFRRICTALVCHIQNVAAEQLQAA